jgi:hypothetical protein
MYMNEGTRPFETPSAQPYVVATILVAAVGTMLIGLLPGGAMEAARVAFLSLG